MADGHSQTSLVLGVVISNLLLSGIFVWLRVYTRGFLQQNSFGLDDWFIVIAWFTTLAYYICMLGAVTHGYGTHNTDLAPEEYIQVVKWEVIAQLFAVLAYIPAKISIAICLAKIFPGRRLRWVLWIICILNFLFFVYAGVIQLAQCTPAAKQWDPSIPGSCINPLIVADGVLPAGAVGAASDFALAIIPWIYIVKLQMTLREKLAVGVALSLGFVAGAFSIIKTYYITRLSSRTDYAYDTVPLVLWSVGEQCAILIGASIPMLRPLLMKFSGRQSTQGSSRRIPEDGTIGSYRPRRNLYHRSVGDELTLISRPDMAPGEILVERSIEIKSGPSDETASSNGTEHTMGIAR